MIIKKRRWITLIASFVISLCLGFVYSWSVFVEPLKLELNETVTALSLVFTLVCGVMSIFNIFGGALHDKYGPKKIIMIGAILYGGGILLSGYADSVFMMYLSFGVCSGIGLGFCYCSLVANVSNFFPDIRGTVVGIVLAAYGSGSIIFAPLSQYMTDMIGVMNTFKIMGITIMAAILLASTLVERAPLSLSIKASNTKTKIIVPDKHWRQMINDPLYYAALLMLIITTTSGLMIISQASPMAQSIVGTDPVKAAWLVGIVAIANACGRFFWGMISDFIGRARSLTLIYVLATAMMFLLVFVKDGQFILFTVCALMIGFCYGGGMGIFPSLTTDSFGTRNSGTNFGFVMIGSAIGSYIGPMLVAQFSSVLNSYSPAFIVAALMSITGIFLSLYANNRIRKNQLHNDKGGNICS